VLASGFPVPETLEEFRTLIAAPLLHGPPQPHTSCTWRPAGPRRRTWSRWLRGWYQRG
jgi:hypothetical protein